MKFVINSQSSLRTWEFHYETISHLANFETNLEVSGGSYFVGMWQSNFIIALGCCFEMSAFTVQGIKAIPKDVGQEIIESWLVWKAPSQIGQKLRLPKQTIAKIVDIFVRRGNMEDNKMKKYHSVRACRMM